MKDDWKFVAMVMDRMFLWIFTLAVFGNINFQSKHFNGDKQNASVDFKSHCLCLHSPSYVHKDISYVEFSEIKLFKAFKDEKSNQLISRC